MEQLSLNYIASQSLGQTHKWTDSDVISSYKKTCKQLDICQKKLREEREQKGQRKLRKSPSYSKNLSQKAAQQSQQPQRGGRNDDVVMIRNIENVSKQSKHQEEESALRVEEKRLIRMKNALWRRMGPLVGCVGKGNKPVSTKTLKCSPQNFFKGAIYPLNYELIPFKFSSFYLTVSISPSPYQWNEIYSEQQKNCLTNADSSSYVPIVPRCNHFIQNRRIQRRIRHESAINPYLSYFRQLPRQNTNNLFANQIFNGINW
ncbi:hypothetical protein RclHR1_04150006 [Rhizophagus clarus]|uniref:Uncharacterized protein n=1 Tax=Rhizophagus clarus TaxID=94130 RepID=A0A2Z6RY29_9GLOM|nr:hypothetical protein RclHR1_04150006 [Rhizophagus clarus]GES85633.1 hypothetical protein GLOIN_2v1835733 [Rhizophagus clarus]